MQENGCVASFQDADEKISFTYSYADQYAKSRGLEKTLKHLYSVFDKEPAPSYAALAASSDAEENVGEEQDVFYGTEDAVEDGPYEYKREDSPSGIRNTEGYSREQTAKAGKSARREEPLEWHEDRSEAKKPEEHSESSFARMILDPGFLGSHSKNERDNSLRKYRADLRAALVTEPPEASRGHLLRAMEDLWLPVN